MTKAPMTLKTICFLLFSIVIHSSDACPLADKRICDINTNLSRMTGDHVVTYVETFSEKADFEYVWVIGAPDRILIGDSTAYDYDELFLILAHEFGHSYYGHGRRLTEPMASQVDRALPDAQLFLKYANFDTNSTAAGRRRHIDVEYEADEFAGVMAILMGIDPVKTMKRLPLATNERRHPSKRSRITRISDLIPGITDIR